MPASCPASAAVKAVRSAAIGAFGATGLPHRRIEEWKYTDLRANLKDVLAPAIHDETPLTIAELIVALGPLAHVDADRVAFVNGRRRPALDDMSEPAGIEVTALETALQSVTDGDARRFAADPADVLAVLNTAFMTDGALVRVNKGATIKRPLLIVYVRAGSERRSVTVRNVIEVGAGHRQRSSRRMSCCRGLAGSASQHAFGRQGRAGRNARAREGRSFDAGKCVHLANGT